MRLLKLVPDDTNFDFLRWRKLAIVISTVLIIASVALIAVRGLNFGVDFAGGQLIRVTFAQPVSVDDLRDQVGDLGLGDPSIQEFGSSREVAIRLPLPEGGEAGANAAASRVRQALVQQYPGARIDAVETVSGKVSGELVRSGALALLLAMIGIAIYIWVRFEWQFGVGGLFSLFHDVTLTLGFFALTQMEFDLNVIAALLTLIGYSLNDTIQSFTIALLFSVIVGTYSTIYIASPFLIWLKVDSDSFLPKTAAPGTTERGEHQEGYTR